MNVSASGLWMGILVLGACAWSCGGGSGTLKETTFEQNSFLLPGLPSFQLQMMPRSTDEMTGIDLSINIPNSSMVFGRSPRGFTAIISIDVMVFDEGEDNDIRVDQSWIDTVVAATYDQTQMLDTRSIERYIPVLPGNYVVHVALEDLNTGKRTVRRHPVSIPAVLSETPTTGAIQVSIRQRDNYYTPFLGMHLPLPQDSVRCSFRLYNIASADSVTVRIVVLKFPSDTSVASHPFAFSSTRGSMEYSAIADSPIDTITTIALTLHAPQYGEDVKCFIAISETGVYSIVGIARVAGDSLLRNHQLPEVRRTLAVMDRGFPRPSTLDEVIGPLVYIARKSELDTLRGAATSDEKHRRFDSFWLSLGGSHQASANLIKQYYTRVEEANLYFSSFKEGWQTDRGMVYVILGPPLSVQSGLNAEVWRYSSSEQDILNTYTFQRVPLSVEGWPFDHFVLDRQAYYDQPWSYAVDRWRRGVGF